MISHIDSFTSQISSKYVPYSLHRSTDHIWSILGIILVVLYKVSHLIPHKHLIYFIRHSLYIHLYQDRTTNSQLSHAVLSPRTPNARQTPRGRQDNHTDTSCITSTLDGNYRPSDLFIEPVNTTPSYGKPYVHNTYGRPNVTHISQHICGHIFTLGQYVLFRLSVSLELIWYIRVYVFVYTGTSIDNIDV